MRRLKTILIVVGIILVAEIVYAATSYSVPAGGGVVQVNEPGLSPSCKNITNNNGLPLFVPTGSQAEWSSLLNNGAPNVSFSTCGTCTYAFEATQNVCANSLNQPTLNPVYSTGVCDAAHLGWYDISQSPGGYGDSSCNASTGGSVRYREQKCIQTSGTCPTPACSIQILAGGLGGGGTSFHVGMVLSVSNSSGSTSNCSASANWVLGPDSANSYTQSSVHSLTQAPGTSNADAPSFNINTGSPSFWPAPFPVTYFSTSLTLSSITCPAGTSPTMPVGTSAFCNETLQGGSSMNGCTSSIIVECR